MVEAVLSCLVLLHEGVFRFQAVLHEGGQCRTVRAQLKHCEARVSTPVAERTNTRTGTILSHVSRPEASPALRVLPGTVPASPGLPAPSQRAARDAAPLLLFAFAGSNAQFERPRGSWETLGRNLESHIP